MAGPTLTFVIHLERNVQAKTDAAKLINEIRRRLSLSCAGRRRSNCLLQFLAVVPNQEHFCLPEWPMDLNAGDKVFTSFHKLVHIVGNFHGVAPQFRRRDENAPFVWSRCP